MLKLGGYIKQEINSMAQTMYSLIAVAIGLLFLIGGIKKWKTLQAKAK